MKRFFCTVLFLLLAFNVAALVLPPGAQQVLLAQQQAALSLTFLAAFIAGIISYTSPCGFVILPVFFGVLFKEPHRRAFMVAVFSAGLVSALALIGFLAGVISEFFTMAKPLLGQVSGVALMLFGVLLFLNKGIGRLDFSVGNPKSAFGVFLLGMFLGVGWTPCTAAVIAAIFFTSITLGSPLVAALFGVVFGLGMVMPLLVFTVFTKRATPPSWLVSKPVEMRMSGLHVTTHIYNIIAGLLLIITGTIMVAWQGTGFFMDNIPLLIPWDMSSMVAWNQVLVTMPVFTSPVASLVGLVFAVAVGWWLVGIIRKK